MSYNFTAFGKIHALVSNSKPLLSKAEDLKFKPQPFENA
jgi:hypothetical protein